MNKKLGFEKAVSYHLAKNTEFPVFGIVEEIEIFFGGFPIAEMEGNQYKKSAAAKGNHVVLGGFKDLGRAVSDLPEQSNGLTLLAVVH